MPDSHLPNPDNTSTPRQILIRWATSRPKPLLTCAARYATITEHDRQRMPFPGSEGKAHSSFVGGKQTLPTISMFYGIVIRMYFFDDRQHHVPHIHAEYAGQKAVFNVSNGAVLAGNLPPGKARLVQAWIEIHRDELLANWSLAVNGEDVFRIAPLK